MMKCRVCNSVLDHTGSCPDCGFDEGLAFEYYPSLQPIRGLSISGRRKKWEAKNVAKTENHFPANLSPDTAAQSGLSSKSLNTESSAQKVSVPATASKSVVASAEAKHENADTDQAYKKARIKLTVARVIASIIVGVQFLLCMAFLTDLLWDHEIQAMLLMCLPIVGLAFLSDGEDHPVYVKMLAACSVGIAAAFIPIWLMVMAQSDPLDFSLLDNDYALFIIPISYAIGFYTAWEAGRVPSKNREPSAESKTDIISARVLTVIIVIVHCVISWDRITADSSTGLTILLISPVVAVPLLFYKRTPSLLVLLSLLTIGFAATICFGFLSMQLFEPIGLADTGAAMAFLAVSGIIGFFVGFAIAGNSSAASL